MAHTAAYERFMASMKIDYMAWHEGTGYDLDALGAVSSEELAELEALLLQRKDSDWRDVDALARIGSPGAMRGIQECLTGPNRDVRIRAAELLHKRGELASLDAVIIEGLRFGALGKGLAQCERLAAAHPSEAVKNELIRGALCSNDGRAVRFVGILFFLYGKANVPFDWSQRPFFLRFNTKDARARRQAFDEMCRVLGIDGSKIRCDAEEVSSRGPLSRLRGLLKGIGR